MEIGSMQYLHWNGLSITAPVYSGDWDMANHLFKSCLLNERGFLDECEHILSTCTESVFRFCPLLVLLLHNSKIDTAYYLSIYSIYICPSFIC